MTEARHLPLKGELTIVAAAALREQLLQRLRSGSGDLVLELDAVEACDSAGVQLLLAAHRSLQAAGSRLILANPAEPVRSALATFGLQWLADAAQPGVPA